MTKRQDRKRVSTMSEKSDRKMYAQRMKQVDGLFERNPTNIREEMEKLEFKLF